MSDTGKPTTRQVFAFPGLRVTVRVPFYGTAGGDSPSVQHADQGADYRRAADPAAAPFLSAVEAALAKSGKALPVEVTPGQLREIADRMEAVVRARQPGIVDSPVGYIGGARDLEDGTREPIIGLVPGFYTWQYTHGGAI